MAGDDQFLKQKSENIRKAYFTGEKSWETIAREIVERVYAKI